MDSRTVIQLDVPEVKAGEEACLALREGEVLRASVHEVTEEGRVRLGLLGLQTWVRSEAELFVGQELDLLVQSRGEGIQLRILGMDEATRSLCRESLEPSLETHSDRILRPSELEVFHAGIEEDTALQDEALLRRASGAFAALPLPAAPSGAWTASRLYFTSDENGEQLVLHLCPGQEGELRVDLHVGLSGVDLRAVAKEMADVECLRALLPELEQTLAGIGLALHTGAIRGGAGNPPAVMDLMPPRADGRPRLDEEA